MKLEVEDIAYKILIINSLFFINSYIISYRINHQRKQFTVYIYISF